MIEKQEGPWQKGVGTVEAEVKVMGGGHKPRCANGLRSWVKLGHRAEGPP